MCVPPLAIEIEILDALRRLLCTPRHLDRGSGGHSFRLAKACLQHMAPSASNFHSDSLKPVYSSLSIINPLRVATNEAGQLTTTSSADVSCQARIWGSG
ncbi:GD14119 [Drosophila simulans]|uniref:GD14119 n=1 Tax=Drosophila simulans TaxID=7240 RepID=B4QM66_DROSI|nr:GD14119 [Drosophila simulans]